MLEITKLLKIKEDAKEALEKLVYGTIEIRENENNKYVYVHYRKDNKQYSRYVDEYSKEVINELNDNNKMANQLKKTIKEIENKLKKIGYVDQKLKDNVKLNIDFVRRNLVDTIYKQSILEGISTTEATTENIIEGGLINDMSSTDIEKILNLKHAWDFILDENVIQVSTDFNILSNINKQVIDNFYYNAGVLRTTPVKISGTKYTPPFPIESKIKEDLDRILNRKISHVERAIELLLYVMKNQIFIDGNKRSAVIFANHYLISHGLGLIVIPAELVDEYRKLLINYYEGKQVKEIKDFLKGLCYVEMY